MALTDRPSLQIFTERLLLRPVIPADARATAALVTEDVASSLSTWPYPMTVEEALAKIQGSMERFATSDGLDLAILRADDATLMGWLGFLAEGESTRLAYWLGGDFRGRGVVTEAAKAAIPAASDFLGSRTFHALVLKTNEASTRVLQRLGFSLVREELVKIETRDSEEACLRFHLQLQKPRAESLTAQL